MLEQDIQKPRDFQVMITILEAQQLVGLDIDPIIRIEVGEQRQYTTLKQSTSNPYFNEVSRSSHLMK